MIRLYLKLSLPIMIIFLTVSLAARALGTTQPPNPALRGFVEGCEGKPQPCWYGIVPGVTTLEELERIQNEKVRQVITDLEDSCEVSVSTEGEFVYGIWMRDCADMMLGDFVIPLGTPRFFIVDCYAGTDYTLNNSVRVLSPTNLNSPFSEVDWVSILAANSLTLDMSMIDIAYLWQGFRTQQTYQRVQPQISCVSHG